MTDNTVPAYTLQGDAKGMCPLVLDSPHSGIFYPTDIELACDVHRLRQTEDSFVDHLFGHAPNHGIPLLNAHISRAMLDLNRAVDDIDPAILDGVFPGKLNPSDRSLVGHGLIRHLCWGAAVYKTKIPAAVAMQRVETYYKPYHATLKKLLADTHARFGAVWHINCHSMASTNLQGFEQATEDAASARADFVLGDRDGTTCEPAFMDIVAQLLRKHGYRVVFNDPYKGMEILRLYGRPAEGFHSLQLEINKGLYMNEDSLERSDMFETVQRDLGEVALGVKEWALNRASSLTCDLRMAAE